MSTWIESQVNRLDRELFNEAYSEIFKSEPDEKTFEYYSNLLKYGITSNSAVYLGLLQSGLSKHKDPGESEQPVLTMNSLGKLGRFGNQIFQYAFLKIYAEKHKLRLEIPEWDGQYLFGCSDPVVKRRLPVVHQVNYRLNEDPIPSLPFTLENVDLWGYFQYHTSFYAPYRNLFCSLFKPIPEIESKMQEAVSLLRSKGKTIVSLHLRRGDFGTRKEWDFAFIAPCDWYKEWLGTFWNRLESPVLFIASDEPEKVLSDFKEYNPVTSTTLGIELPAAEFYPDFYILSKSDIVAISNSSFSFSASMLNDKATTFVRPDPEQKKLVSFDPWNSEVSWRSKDAIL
jgi:hypothetical protein